MKTKLVSLACVALLSLTTTAASAARAASPMMTRPAAARPASRFTSRTMTGTHHFRHFRNRTFVFIDAFGFPVFDPYPYSYYPYDYYGGSSDYGYTGVQLVVQVQRRLARAGYYHGAIDGILGPETRRAIAAYEREHQMPAYGVLDRQLLNTLGLG
jgi:putative peptidoglycan binding protein